MTHEDAAKVDPFIGLWEFDPQGALYEFGQPPLSGRYHIQPDGDGYLITMEWSTAKGQSHRLSYRGIPDGKEYPSENPAVADTISMSRVDHRTLDSTAKKAGHVTSYARRVLSADGRTMTITQSGTMPEGQEFTNLSIYQKQ